MWSQSTFGSSHSLKGVGTYLTQKKGYQVANETVPNWAIHQREEQTQG